MVDLFAASRARRAALEQRIADLSADPTPLLLVERAALNGAPRAVIKTYLVSGDPSRASPWRLTWFCDGKPGGHTGRLSFPDVLRAADDYGADVMTARAISAAEAARHDVQPGEDAP